MLSLPSQQFVFGNDNGAILTRYVLKEGIGYCVSKGFRVPFLIIIWHSGGFFSK